MVVRVLAQVDTGLLGSPDQDFHVLPLDTQVCVHPPPASLSVSHATHPTFTPFDVP
jgi:hypothetical protein